MLARLLAAFLLAVSVACGSGTPEPAPPLVRGPLCDLLPSGGAPGSPELLRDEPADVALTWIPVLTIFEAATRAAGVDAELREAGAVTILAPTDGAFSATFTEETIDDLILFRQGELRDLLHGHMIEGSLSLADLLDAGRVTTLAGTTLTVTAAGRMARLDDRGQTVCADYRVAGARIHVIDGVLGELPKPAPKDPEIG